MTSWLFAPLAWHPGTWELVILFVVILLIFGSRLPKVARSLGQGINQFKKGLNDPASSQPDEEKDAKPPTPAP